MNVTNHPFNFRFIEQAVRVQGALRSDISLPREYRQGTPKKAAEQHSMLIPERVNRRKSLKKRAKARKDGIFYLPIAQSVRY